MNKISLFVATFILALAIRPVHASTIQWDLNNVHGGGYTVTGFFDVDSVTSAITAVNLTVVNSGGTVFTDISTAHIETAFDLIFGSVSPGKGVDLFFMTSLLDSAGAINLGFPSDYFDLHHPLRSAFIHGSLDGVEVSAVPLPASMPMMLASLAGITGFATSRRAFQRIK